ncbi:hypothetical protein FWH09_00830 [Candidatus Saccharibacteria bacterium]|nr:hypothetical protein [Candidatus Saccharibacteria bacterium]
MLNSNNGQFVSRRASRAATTSNLRTGFYNGQGGEALSSSARGWTKNRNRVRFDDRVKLGPVAYSVAVIIGVALLGIVALTQTVQATSLDYRLSDLGGEVAELESQRAELIAETARLSSIVNLQRTEVATRLKEVPDNEIIR